MESNQNPFWTFPYTAQRLPLIADNVVGMATCSERYVTGWIGPTILLQDLIVAAINDAQRKADERMTETMGGMMGGLKIPGM